MQKTTHTNNNKSDLIEEMFKAGVHYGYSKTRRHPSLSPFIYTTKNKVDIIDLEKTEEALKDAIQFVSDLGLKNKTILFVGTKAEAKNLIKNYAEALDMPYVSERWIGGTISNFPEIKKRISELENYRKENQDGTLGKYTKKERAVLAKKMEKLARYYSGVISLKKIPDAILIVDAKKEHIALTESKKMDLPVIALVNSDNNIKNIDYPIIGNDSGIPSINLILKELTEAYKNSKKEA